MTWEIVLGIISLVGLIGTVGTWIFKLSKVLATLEATVNALKETVQAFVDENRENHKTVQEKLENHETRITVIEKSR